MAIKKKTESREIVIDLTGPDGNVFVLMGRAMQYAKQLDLDGDKIINEMKVVIMKMLYKCLINTLVHL